MSTRQRHISVSGVMELSVAERIQFVEDVWDSIAEVPDAIELSDEQKEVLDQRLESYRKNPEAGSPWGIVRDRVRGRK